MSAAVAHAHPSFELAEAGARAGDVVHFSISDAKGRVSYELEVGDHDVAEGSAPAGNAFAGSFVMPDLGEDARKVTVEAELRESSKHKTIKRKLEYLGPAPTVNEPTPAAAPADPPPVVIPQALNPPAPLQTPNATVAPASPAAGPRSDHRPRQSRKRRTADRRRSTQHGSGRARAQRRARAKHRRRGPDRAGKIKSAKRLPPRTAPLFDGVPEPGARTPRRREGDGSSGLTAVGPRAAVVSGTGAGAGGGISTALAVPGLLGLAGLALAGAAISRKRARRN